MAAISLSAVRQRVAAAIDSALGGGGWQESGDPYDQFGQGDGERLHESYAVGIPSTSALQDRQKVAEGVLSDTNVRVKWAFNLSALDQVVAYDSALEAGDAVLAAVMAIQQSEDMHLVYQSGTHPVDADGWMLGDLSFRVIHHRPFAS